MFAATDLNSITEVNLSNDAFMGLHMNRIYNNITEESYDVGNYCYEDKILLEDDDNDLHKFNNMNRIHNITKNDYKSIKNSNIKNST